MSRREALRLMSASLDVLAGKKPDTKVLFGGLTGNPIFLELRTTGYRNELKEIMRRGLRRIAREGIEDLRGSMDVIVAQMQNAAQRWFPMALKFGLGPRQTDADDDRTIDLALASNAAFLSNSLRPAIETRIQEAVDADITFAEAVRDSEDFAVNRSGLYAGAFWTMIWAGRLSALVKKKGPRAGGQVPVQRVLDPRAKHCPTCPPKADVYSSWDEMLMLTGGLPADGSDDCHCITTGNSRVLTARGEVPIRDVRVGDSVMTHKGRWRTVLNTTITLSGADHKQARMRTPTDRVIGCTQDHLWLTPDGWRTTVSVADSRLSVYNVGYANKLSNLRREAPLESEVEYMCGVCEGVRVREKEGSSSEAVFALRDVYQGHRTVGQPLRAHKDIGRNSGCRPEAPAHIRSVEVGALQSSQDGWQGVCSILGRGWKETLYSSLSMGVDQREWANSRRNGHASQEPRLLRRQNRELGNNDGFGSWETSPQTEQPSALRMSDVPDGVYENPAEGSPQQVLLAGVLPLGTPLYDLTVDEDHSFIIEGLISHNSNCRCRIKILDEGSFTYVI